MRVIILLAMLSCALMLAGLGEVQAAQDGTQLAAANSDEAGVKDAVPPAKKKRKRKCLRFLDRGICRKWQKKRCVERRPVCVKRNQQGACIKYVAQCTKWEKRKCLEWAKKPRCRQWADE
jgi:hypothetical protein